MMAERLRKLFLRALVIVFALLLLAFAFLRTVLTRSASSISDRALVESVRVYVPPGASAGQVGALLKQKGLVWSPVLFRWTSKLMSLDRRLRHGYYEFPQNSWLLPVLAKLWRGDIVRISVTIPEGFRAEQIADILEKAGLAAREDFMFVVTKEQLEGYLFPARYSFEYGLAAEQIVRIMRLEFEDHFTEELKRRAAEIGMTMNQAVALASIVERETRIPEERSLVSSVFHNRLKIRKPLEADPTVRYALRQWNRPVSYKDLRVHSPYNTYRRYGLPPGPICSPGLDSIRAALWPVQSPYLYFVAKGDGTHTFHRTYDSHLRAKREAKRRK